MNATDKFKEAIKSYLDMRAGNDELFATSYAKQDKSLDNCINYILKTVQRSGCNGFADDEIYSMAMHYYDEDNIDDAEPIQAQVAINHHVELSEEEKREIEQRAKDAYFEEVLAAQRKLNAPTKKPEKKVFTELSLF